MSENKYQIPIFVEIAREKPLLFLAVILLNAISIVTTSLGFSLVWQGGSPLMAWAFASAIGLILVHLTFEVAGAQPGKSVTGYVLGYVVLAAVSVFFNFNAFFGKMAAPSLEVNTISQLQFLHDRVYKEAEARIRKDYDIDELESQLASALAGMEYEKKRPDLPGSGPRYRSHLRDYEEAKQQLARQRVRYEESLTQLSGSGSNPENVDNFSYNRLHARSAQERDRVRRLLAALQGLHGFNPSLSEEEMLILSSDERKTDLWFSLSIVAEETDKALKGDWRQPTFLKALVALVVSLLIDVPVFVAVVASHKRTSTPLATDTSTQRPAAGRAQRNLVYESEGEMWAPTTRQDDPRSNG
jgi:hypothetical protein